MLSGDKVHKFWEGHKIFQISALLLSYVVPVKSKVEILQNFVAFSEYMNSKIVVTLIIEDQPRVLGYINQK